MSRTGPLDSSAGQYRRRSCTILLSALLFVPVLLSAQSSAALSSRSAVVNGIVIHYQTAGTGPPLLLLHGYGWSSQEWERFVPSLAHDFTLIIPDMRGHGRSSRPQQDFLQRDVAADVLALLGQLGFDSVSAVGHSGGANALYLAAALEPERFSSLVVIGAQHEFTESNRRAMQSYPAFDALPAVVRDVMMGAHPGGREQIDWLLDQFRKLGANRNDLNLTPDRLSQIDARVLIVVGDGEDVALALTEKRAIPAASLWVIPSQGHFPFWEEFGGSAVAAEDFPGIVREFALQAD